MGPTSSYTSYVLIKKYMHQTCLMHVSCFKFNAIFLSPALGDLVLTLHSAIQLQEPSLECTGDCAPVSVTRDLPSSSFILL